MNLFRFASIVVAVCPVGLALALARAPRRNPLSWTSSFASLFKRPPAAPTPLIAGKFTQWQTWSELLVLRNLRPESFVFCALPKNGCSLWKQAMLRAGGNEHWNTTLSFQIHNPVKSGLDLVGVVNGGNPDDPEARNFTDIAAVFGPKAAKNRKAVIVRDPITRMLSAYLDRCRDLKEWYRCLAHESVSFEEVVSNYEKVTVENMDVHFRPQVEMCGLRYVEYDMIGKMEDFETDSRRIMEWAGLWEQYGRSGWGPDGLSAFAEGVQLQSNHLRTHDTVSKVCQFYTPELLSRVQKLYADDFLKFGYDAGTWLADCSDAWGARQRSAAQPLALYARPPPLSRLFRGALAPMHSRPPCAPPAGAIDSLVPTLKQEPKQLRYYLYDTGDFDFSVTVNCLYDKWGVKPKDMSRLGGLDKFVGPNISEHLGELWLFQQFPNHTQRTTAIEEADVYFVAVPAFTSYIANRYGCGTSEDHKERMTRVLNRLLKLHHFTTGGQNFVFFVTTPHVNHALTPDLVWALQEHRSIVATADYMYPDWHAYDNISKIILPYKAHAELDRSAMSGEKSPAMQLRNVSFMFHGNLNRTFEGKHRDVMLPLATRLPDSDIRSVQFFRYKDFRHRSMSSANTMTRSQFCLVPAGDTPTSRRLFDAIAAGCVPIVFADFENITKALPFQATVDWSKFVIFGGGLGCVADHKDQEAAWLDWVRRLSSHDKMRELGRKAFREHLSYLNGEAFLNAFLRQLRVDFY